MTSKLLVGEKYEMTCLEPDPIQYPVGGRLQVFKVHSPTSSISITQEIVRNANWQSSRIQTIISAGEDEEKKEHFYTVSGMVN